MSPAGAELRGAPGWSSWSSDACAARCSRPRFVAAARSTTLTSDDDSTRPLPWTRTPMREHPRARVRQRRRCPRDLMVQLGPRRACSPAASGTARPDRSRNLLILTAAAVAAASIRLRRRH
ncbi:hypothetical protein SETIT_8G084300v2 [Setaria italica]|uniref:Uncharacterized protein n=1 Tax=Setaria italica TaxID=4555 RepID=K3ZKB3_SETIT|nr:hypothetical protein SETIT_8G084300v2 [Setaria italica]